jgi:hypothetical protein
MGSMPETFASAGIQTVSVLRMSCLSAITIVNPYIDLDSSGSLHRS